MNRAGTMNGNERCQVSTSDKVILTVSGQAARVENYTYDAVDQLIGASYTGGRSVSYNYDPVGNRLSVADNGTQTSYTPNALNQYSQIGGAPVTNDANGNLSAHDGKTYGYDAQNRLVSVSSVSSVVNFVYDARNRCVSRTINGVTTYLFYDGWNLIEERDAAGNQIARYIHGAQMDELLTLSKATGTFYFSQDALGSVTHLSDATGSVVERYTYDAFGAPTILDPQSSILAASAIGNRFMFTGREYLAALNLYDYRYRVYSPTLGRFLQTDPLRFGAEDVNIYRYVGNYATHWRDPFGLWSFDVDVFWLIGGGFSIGKNPNGTSFLSIRLGVGEKAGISFTPTATSPAYKPDIKQPDSNPDDPCDSDRGTDPGYGFGGVYGNAGIGIAVFDLGLEGRAGGRTGGGYGEFGPTFAISYGMQIGYSLGVEFGLVGK